MSARAIIRSTSLILFAACASVPGRTTTLLDDRQLDTALAGTGRPIVLFEAGLGADLTTWKEIFPEVSSLTTAFAYSRPGYGSSDRTSTPRTGSVVVEELRATLRAKGLPPPYLLVGHSLGGLYLQLFARLHPDEVAGLLLIDSAHPSQFAGERGRPSITWWTALVRLYMSGTRGREFHAMDETGQQVLAAPPLVGKPVTVLNAGVDPTTLGRPLNEREELRVDLFRLNPGCKQRWVASDHVIQRSHPRVVIDAIRELLEEIRAAR